MQIPVVGVFHSDSVTTHATAAQALGRSTIPPGDLTLQYGRNIRPYGRVPATATPHSPTFATLATLPHLARHASSHSWTNAAISPHGDDYMPMQHMHSSAVVSLDSKPTFST